jgi:hypothetical protein
MRQTAIVSAGLIERAAQPLRERGFDVCSIPFCSRVDPRIGSHPDIQLCCIQNTVFVHPDLPAGFIRHLEHYAEVVVSSQELGNRYPFDCAYNAAFTGRYALCRKESTAAEILRHCERRGIPVINLPQGYARCSILIISEDRIATEDNGIAAAAQKAGIETMLIEPGSVPLKGFPRGFLGGASGSDTTAVYFSGSIEYLNSSSEIREKIRGTNKTVIELPGELEDFGSILFTG